MVALLLALPKMKITAIKQQIKNTQRYSVFVDEKYSFSLSELALINAGLSIGKELTKEDVKVLKAESDFDKSYNRVLDLLSRRPRSQWEIDDYLKRKKEDPETIEKILNKLTERSLVNDLAFAESWVENRRLLKNVSKRRLQQELRAKRVSDEIINEILGNDETDELEVLHEVIKNKRQQTRYKDEAKLIQYLMRQGFNYGDIKQVLNETAE